MNVLCGYGEVPRLQTSWSQHNPARRFLGCPNYLDPTTNCNFFQWVDAPLPNRWYLMCAYLHILFRPKIRPKTPNTNQICQENVCFVFVHVQVRIYEKWTKTKPTPTKTSTRTEKGQKPEPGKLNDQRKPEMSIEVLRDSESYKISPWLKLDEFDNFSPCTSTC